jgi:murein DD-endopeptidase MepM/ murein hydrolase activator NlpD
MKLYLYFLSLLICFVIIASIDSCQKDSSERNSKSCIERAVFENPDSSAYILPFPVDKKYICSQTYCNPNGGHKNQLAYDFALSIGDSVIAARSGIVKEIKKDQPDSIVDSNSTHNFIMIEHQDGSVAFYAHLMQNSVCVRIGDTIMQGNFIALSGNSGYTANFPHLHFGVYKNYPPVETFDVPVNFRNADGPLNENNGLIADQWYIALRY